MMSLSAGHNPRILPADKWGSDFPRSRRISSDEGHPSIAGNGGIDGTFGDIHEDAHEIQKGDILITYATDIGWAPYFPLLAGVVTELGGLMSHGRFAREAALKFRSRYTKTVD